MELKLHKRLILAVLLVVVFASLAGLTIVGSLWHNASADEASADKWDGDLAAAGWGGYGTKPAEYIVTYENGTSGKVSEVEIGSAAALAYFAHEVYADSSRHYLDGATVTLTVDVNLDNQMWVPIGQTDNSDAPTYRFSGTFNGNGKTIYNLNSAKFFENLVHDGDDNYHVGYPTASNEEVQIPFGINEDGEFCYGLFGCAADVTVQNLSLKGINMVVRDYDFRPIESPEEPEEPEMPECDCEDCSSECNGSNCAEGCSCPCCQEEPEMPECDCEDCSSECDGSNCTEDCICPCCQEEEPEEPGQEPEGPTNPDESEEPDEPVVPGEPEDKNSATKPLVPSSLGAIIGYGIGAVTLENCQAGSLDTNDQIAVTTDIGGSYGGLIGRINADSSSNIEIKGCRNYVDITFNYFTVEDVMSHVGGLLGYTGDSKGDLDIFNCVNYGNISGGSYVGGITSVFAGSDGLNGSDSIVDCDNHGNILSKNSICSAGIANIDGSNYTTYKISGCNNYGNVSGGTFAGGIMGLFYDEGAGQSDLTDNYNYGDIYSYGTDDVYYNDNSDCTSAAGGYIGCAYVADGGSITYSGGNLGTVYGTATNVNSIFGYLNGLSTEMHMVDAGNVETQNIPEEVPEQHPSYERVVYDDKEKDRNGILYLADGGKTVVGLVETATLTNGTVTIPAQVTKIAAGAFVGESRVQQVVFAGNNVTTIERLAFAATNIKTITLPKGLKIVGDGAFASCSYLNNVILPEDATDIEFGKNVFDNTRAQDGAFLIAQNSKHYWNLVMAQNLEQYDDTLTHVVTINYVYDDVDLEAPDLRLRGQSYNIVLNNNGLWVVSNSVTFGPDGHKDIRWSADNGNIYNSENIDELLANVGGDSVTLRARSGEKMFIAREDLVYDPNRRYTLKEINSLLEPSGDRVTADMQVAIVKYNDSTENLPTVIHNAGVYTIRIDSSEITITIQRATIDLSNLSNLEWKITDIGGNAANAELMSYTLYIYTNKTTGAAYPSREILSNEQIQIHNLNNSYERKYVDYSVARIRNGAVTIDIVGDGYSKETTGNVGNSVGSYQATSILKATNNYYFTLGSISSTRGMTIELSEGNTKATVTKDWYIVNISNWIVDEHDNDYVIADRVYGQEGSSNVPYPHYGTQDKITMHLSLDGRVIGDASGFSVAEMDKYINLVMPAGHYTLTIAVSGLEAMDEDDSTMVWHNDYTETFTFTVTKASLKSLWNVNDKLREKTFEFSVDSAKLYNDTAAEAVAEFFTNTTYKDRRANTIWERSEYDSYYGDFVIEFNLARDGTDEYVSAAELNMSIADDYTVYYRISAPNFYSSIDNMPTGRTRQYYYFKVIKYEVIAIPEVSSNGLVYTGNRVIPTIATNSLYSIDWDSNDTYISGGEHSVSFSLFDNNHYRWAGHEDNKNYVVTKTFTIAKAENIFTTSLNMLGWSFETFDVATNNIRAAVRYLDAGQSITFRITKKGETTPIAGLSNFTVDANGHVNATIAHLLNKLAHGDYTLYAHVEDTANYYLDSDPSIDFAVTKAMNTWLDGDEDLVLPSWIIGRYDPEVNLIAVNAAHGKVNIIITDLDGNEYYNSITGLNNLGECEVGKYLLKAWVDETDNYAALAERTFTIEVFNKLGLPWWVTLIITVGALAIAALIIFILYKTGVFQLMTEKVVVAIRTRASIEATIASVRAAKMMEEGRQSVEDAKRRERLQKAMEAGEVPAEDDAEDAYAQYVAQHSADAVAEDTATEAVSEQPASETVAEEPTTAEPVEEVPSEDLVEVVEEASADAPTEEAPAAEEPATADPVEEVPSEDPVVVVEEEPAAESVAEDTSTDSAEEDAPADTVSDDKPTEE